MRQTKLLKNGTDRLAECKVATNDQFVKNVVSAKCTKVKHHKPRYIEASETQKKN